MTPLCAICNQPVDPTSPTTLTRVIGWEKRALHSSRRGGSDILARERLDDFAHLRCVELQKQGIPVGQGALSL